MNVVVSAIVDPWVTTLFFVVALAMRIQGAANTDSLHFSGAHNKSQAHDGRKEHLPRNPCALTRIWRETRALAPHNASQKSRILMTI